MSKLVFPHPHDAAIQAVIGSPVGLRRFRLQVAIPPASRHLGPSGIEAKERRPILRRGVDRHPLRHHSSPGDVENVPAMTRARHSSPSVQRIRVGAGIQAACPGVAGSGSEAGAAAAKSNSRRGTALPISPAMTSICSNLPAGNLPAAIQPETAGAPTLHRMATLSVPPRALTTSETVSITTG